MVERTHVYVELTKPRITLMVLLTVALGYFLGATQSNVWVALHVLIGTGLACSGSGTLNQYLERESDGRMDRTRFRPLPARKVSPKLAAAMGAVLVLSGVGYLAITVNTISAALNALTVAAYLFVYTPLKRITPVSTLIGAVPGALPPVIGWSAATGSVDPGALALFGVLFLWQIPHFLAIGRMYRDDYAEGGLRMLAVVDPSGQVDGRQMTLYAWALVPTALLLTPLGLAGSVYFWSALLLGLAYVAAATEAAGRPQATSARRLLLASVMYLPLWAAALVIDRLLE